MVEPVYTIEIRNGEWNHLTCERSGGWGEGEARSCRALLLARACLVRSARCIEDGATRRGGDDWLQPHSRNCPEARTWQKPCPGVPGQLPTPPLASLINPANLAGLPCPLSRLTRPLPAAFPSPIPPIDLPWTPLSPISPGVGPTPPRPLPPSFPLRLFLLPNPPPRHRKDAYTSWLSPAASEV